MKQLNNGYCSCYYLTEEGLLYNADNNTFKAANKANSFVIKREDGSTKKIALKQLYRLIYGKAFCKDNIKDLDKEVWREVENTDGNYYISNLGRVKSYAGYEAKLLKPTLTANGYYRLEIVQEGQRAAKLIHRLVAAAFLLPPASIDMQLHHKDFNKLNNNADNLIWLTPKQHSKVHLERKENNSNVGI